MSPGFLPLGVSYWSSLIETKVGLLMDEKLLIDRSQSVACLPRESPHWQRPMSPGRLFWGANNCWRQRSPGCLLASRSSSLTVAKVSRFLSWGAPQDGCQSLQDSYLEELLSDRDQGLWGAHLKKLLIAGSQGLQVACLEKLLVDGWFPGYWLWGASHRWRLKCPDSLS